MKDETIYELQKITWKISYLRLSMMFGKIEEIASQREFEDFKLGICEILDGINTQLKALIPQE